MYIGLARIIRSLDANSSIIAEASSFIAHPVFPLDRHAPQFMQPLTFIWYRKCSSGSPPAALIFSFKQDVIAAVLPFYRGLPLNIETFMHPYRIRNEKRMRQNNAATMTSMSRKSIA
jgi:hypothetical protein